MKRILTGGVFGIVMLLLALRAPAPLFAAALLILGALGQKEFYDLAGHSGQAQPWRRVGQLLGLALIMVFALPWSNFGPLARMGNLSLLFDPFVVLVSCFLIILLTGLGAGERLAQWPLDAGCTLLGLIYPALLLALLGRVRLWPLGMWWVFFLLLVVWAGDIAAFYGCRLWGRHKLAPRLSPGKSWEGSAFSLLAAAVAGAAVAHFSPAITQTLLRLHLMVFAFVTPEPLGPAVGLAIGMNVAAQAGDLIESAFKRAAGVKDSGALLPGHGGILDRIDAMLFAIPALWYFLMLRM